MASIKIEANVQPALTALGKLNTEIKNLQDAASKVKIEIKADGIQKLDKETMNAVKSLAKYADAQAKLTRAQTEAKKAQNDLLIAQNKTKQSVENAEAAYNKYRESLEKTKQAQEKTAQAAQKTAQEQEKTAQAVQKTAQAVQKTAQAQEKTTQVQTKAASAFRDTGNAAEEAGKKTQGFISTFVKSAIIYQAIYAIRQAFMDALDTMKEVDSQLVTVRKVTQATDAEISQMRSKAYQTASKYGVGAGDYLESVAQFARAGYKDMSSTLAELSTKTQIVGDTTAEVANQFLLSMDAAYKYEGSVQKLTRVLDGANEIDNNYATSIEKIAEGLGLIAPIAAQVHVSEQELTSAIGTITAVTQRSGSEAARALRALFLNIIGDTTTEIEDGVTATEESVTSLRDLLKEYAPDAVKAAEATGKIIDPMEAIASLSKAMEDGLLTEQELMEKLSSLGGKLRTSQLVALVSNFDMYKDMMATYADSVGSADKEVENALDSWERKTAILANTWTEFIQGSINTDFIKGFLDGLTQVIRLFGNLGNALMTVGGIFVAMKLPSIVESFSNLATKAKDFGKALGSQMGGIQQMQVALIAVTAALTAYNMAAQAHKNALAESTRAAKEEADAALSEADNIAQLYAEYNAAADACDKGTGSKEAMTAASQELKAALATENNEVFDLTKSLEENSIAVLENAKTKVQAAKNAAQYQFMDSLKLGSNTGVGWLDDLINGMGPAGAGFGYINQGIQRDFKKTSEMFIEEYKKQKEVIDEYSKATKNGGEATAELEEKYRKAQEFVGAFGETLEGLMLYDDQLADLDKKIENLPTAMADAADATEEAGETAKIAASSYRDIASAADDAKDALQEFADATATEVNDAFSKYADIYDKFLQDWEAGLKGTNRVKAAIDALLPEEAINDLRAKGMDVGELLANDFYKSIFSAKGEDFGANLAWMLWDNETIGQIENGAKVIKDSVGNAIASITENNGELSVSVSDFDQLAQTMYEITGIPLDANVWQAWMASLGAYSEEIDYTVDDLKNLAEAVGAVDEAGKINLSDIVTGQLEAGESADKIWDLVDALLEANQNGDVELETNAATVDEAREKVKKLIEEYQKTKDEKIGADTKEAETNINAVTDAANEYKNGSPYVSILKVDDQASASILGAISLAKQFEISARNAAANAQAAMNSVTPGGGSNKMATFASGTSSAPGGMTLVNEQGPEVIQEGPFARIAGGGMPTITWVQPGATIYNAGQTKSILGGVDPSLLFGGIGAFAGGTASGITRWSGSKITSSTASASSSSSSSGAYSGGGGGGGSSSSSRASTSSASSASSSAKNAQDAHLEYLKSEVSLREAALALMKAQNLPVKNLIDEEKQIQSALMNEINYLKQIGASDEEIYKLYTQWYNVQKEIADLQKGMLDDLSKAISGQINKLNKAREEEKKILQDQIDALEKARDTRDEQLELEEKILAVQKAEQALQNAMTERTVRFYNASTGQWEWAANASNVKSAAEQLESAQKDLLNYQENAEINALKAQQEEIDARYDDLEDRWQTIIDSLAEPVQSIDDALNVLARNYVPAMEQDIINLNKLIESFGYHVHRSTGTVSHSGGLPVYDNGGLLSGIGGIKATALNEMILPPDITQRMLSVGGGSLIGERLNELRYLYGVTGSLRGNVSNSIGSQHNGDLYQYGNITLSAAQAESMTVAELARASRNLRLYSANM